MALKLNKGLTSKAGLPIPKDNIIVTATHFPKTEVYKDEQGANVYVRKITYDVFNYVSAATVIDEYDNYIQGGSKEIPSGYIKIMTPTEYLALLSNGSLAEVWLKDWVDSIMGAGTATIFDPYI